MTSGNEVAPAGIVTFEFTSKPKPFTFPSILAPVIAAGGAGVTVKVALASILSPETNTETEGVLEFAGQIVFVIALGVGLAGPSSQAS